MRKFGFAFWQSQRDALERMYYEEKKSTKEIAKLYGVYPETIASNMRRMGYKLRRVGSIDRPNALYNVDSEFFNNIDTEEKAYILGFIIADGHVSKNGVLMIGLNSHDIDILEKIKSSMHSDHPIRVNKEKNNAAISIASSPLTSRQNEMGIYHDKTSSLDIKTVLPYVPKEFERHFLRGLFDGDGGLGLYKYPYFKKHTAILCYTGNESIIDYVRSSFGLKIMKIDEGNGFYSVSCKCRKDILRIGHFLYDDATIYLDRKYALFKKMDEVLSKEL